MNKEQSLPGSTPGSHPPFEKLLTSVTRRLIDFNPAELEAVAEQTLALIGEFFSVDRVRQLAI